MRGLDTGQILAAWERAGPASDRAEALLAAAGASDAEELGRLPVGRRDALLLALYRATFADAVDAVAQCPSCGTTVELAASCAALLAQADAAAPVRPLDINGHTVTWRPPSAADLSAVADRANPDAAALALLERCVLSAGVAGGPVPAADLPADVRAALTDEMVAADPLVEMLFELTCPECGSSWQAGFDPAGFLWAKVAARAEQVLREVDTLARAYGWSEPQILALSPARRAAYLRMVGDG